MSKTQVSMPVIGNLKDFNHRSGNIVERLVFNFRSIVLLIGLVFTLGLGYFASQLTVNSSFDRMIPQAHPFIQEFFAVRNELSAMNDSVRIAIVNKQGSIYDPEYLETLRQINETVFLTPGVDRAFMRSLWTPLVRWTEVSEYGFVGGPVMPDNFDGSEASLRELTTNIHRAGLIGSLVSSAQDATLIVVPLLTTNPQTGQPLDYAAFSRALEERVRSFENEQIGVHIIGFAKLSGDLIEGVKQVALFFLVSALFAALFIGWFTRCYISTSLVLTCSIIAVIWQLGIMQLLGYVLDPYSVLVPFLVFAIGVSHALQKMNGIVEDIARGTHPYVAARYTFRRLFAAGVTALVADAVGFGVLALIDIPIIRDLVISASIGIVVLVFTNLLLLPVMLSYTGVTRSATRHALKQGQHSNPLYRFFEMFTQRGPAIIAIGVFGVLLVAGLGVRQQLQVGDLDEGAPELRTDSRYNRDVALISQKFGLSNDVFVVIVRAPDGGLNQHPALIEMDRLEQLLRETEGVQSTLSAASQVRQLTPGFFEGNLKWFTINRDRAVITDALNMIAMSNPELSNESRSTGALIAYLTDHKAETLQRVVEVVQEFAEHTNRDQVQFLLAAGSAGIEAATNEVVARANQWMLLAVFVSVGLLCWINFGSLRAVAVALVPLIITAFLCEALMVFLGIGLKVATLPVVALGVGIGVDYALYLLSVQLQQQRQGRSLAEAYGSALRFTGKMVILVAFTLSIGVATWIFSPIKFQADMGVLLAFMFLWNMISALILIPALSRFLLSEKTA